MWRPAGLTLVDVLVGVALGLLAIAGATALLRGAAAARARAGAGVDRLAAAASALDHVVRDVRQAGYDPQERGLAAVVAASASRIVLAADLDGDGTVDPASEERVEYRASAAGDTLLRIVGTQSMSILSDLAPGGLRFAYRGDDGTPIDPATAGLAAIRVVTVEIATSPAHWRAGDSSPAIHLAGGGRLLNR